MKRLYRVKEGKRVAGVCAGLGEYFNVDPTWIRILFLVVSVFWGFGVILYLICWLVMPRKDELNIQV